MWSCCAGLMVFPGLPVYFVLLGTVASVALTWRDLVFASLIYWGAVIYAGLVLSVYWRITVLVRLILALGVPMLAGLLVIIALTYTESRRVRVGGFVVWLTGSYLLVCAFILLNLGNFLLCSHGPDYAYDSSAWHPGKILIWPYMLLKGEHLPDEPCYWQ